MSGVATYGGKMSQRGSSWFSGAADDPVAAPTITSFDPTSAAIGDTVTITGTNYEGTITVEFSTDKVATISSKTSTSIVCVIPSGSVDGPITVTNALGTVDSSTNFDVTAAAPGSAPNYAHLVTRESIGYSGEGVQNHLADEPLATNAAIIRLDCQCQNITEYYTLNEALDNSETLIDVTLPSSFVIPGSGGDWDLEIDDEVMRVTNNGSGSPNRTLTVTRGAYGTTPAAHSNGAEITGYHWNALDADIKKILDGGAQCCLLVTYNNPQYTGFTGDIFAVPSKNGTTPSPCPSGKTFDQWATWWANKFAKAVARRYHKDGDRKPNMGVLNGLINSTYCVNFYQIWNECNNSSFWAVDGGGSYVTNGLYAGIQDVAELIAKAYDAMHDISAELYVGCGGTAGGRKDPPVGGGARSYVFFRECLNKWAAMNVPKHANGWTAKCPLDWACHHAYVYRRTGASQSNVAYSPVDYDLNTNGFTVDTVLCHNEFHAKGFGSIKMWCTESDVGWDPEAETGYGFRGWVVANRGSYVQVQNDPWYREDRTAQSPGEAYTYLRQIYRYWTGADAWPQQTTATGGARPRWNVLHGHATVTVVNGNDTYSAASPIPLGPKFHFTGTEDFDNPGGRGVGFGPQGDYAEYWDHAQHFGFWRVNGDSKAVAGNDAIDAMKLFPMKP